MTMEVTIERILPGGIGLAHAGGKTVMAPLTVPGDRLRVQIDREKGNTAFASIVEILERGKDRVEPPCPYFGRCGGCDFQQLSYEAQLHAKIEIIKDCLHRIGGIDDLSDFEIVAAPNEWHYRSRAQWQYDADCRRLGYFESGSRRVCDVAECAVLVPELQRTLEHFRQLMSDGVLPHDVRYFRAIVGDVDISLASNVENSGPGKESNGEIVRRIKDERYSLNADVFFQTNLDLVPRLIEAAVRHTEGDTAVELYCGVGLFTLPLGRRFKRVIAVEADAAAANFARKNLLQADLTNTEVVNTEVGDWFAQNHQIAEQQIDFLLLDPPRTGADSRVISGILKLRPTRICYVSCDPATLARDMKKLLEAGYFLDSLVAFDMFPQTHHVETIVHLCCG